MIDPSQFPRALGTNLMASQSALNDWLLADKTGSGASLLTTYEAILKEPRIKHSTKVPEPALKLDAALTDLDATLELTAGLVVMRPRMNIERISAELQALDGKNDEFSNKRRDRLTQEQLAWQARVAALAAHTEPLTQHSARIIDLLGNELGAINAAYEAGGAQQAMAPATTYREISIECGKFRAAVNQFISMIRADREEHPSTDMAEAAAQDWIIETLGPRLRQLAMGVGTQVDRLPKYWPGADAATKTETSASDLSRAIYVGGGVVKAPDDIGVDQIVTHAPALLEWMQKGLNEHGRDIYRTYHENLTERMANGWMGNPEVHLIDQHVADYNATVKLLTDLLTLPAKAEMREIGLQQAQLRNRDDADAGRRKEELAGRFRELAEHSAFGELRGVTEGQLGFHRDMGKTMEALRDQQGSNVKKLPTQEYLDHVLYILPEAPGDVSAKIHALRDTVEEQNAQMMNPPMGQKTAQAFCWNVLAPRIAQLAQVLRLEIPQLATSWPDYEALSDMARPVPPESPRSSDSSTFIPAVDDGEEAPEGDKIGRHMRGKGAVSAAVVDDAVARGVVRALFPKSDRAPGGGKS